MFSVYKIHEKLTKCILPRFDAQINAAVAVTDAIADTFKKKLI